MIRKILIYGICCCLFCSLAEARSKGPKWVYHVSQEGQTIEQIVEGYSVLYDVDLEKFCKWNKINRWHKVQQGDIFLIANKPSQKVIMARKTEMQAEKKRARQEKLAEKNKRKEQFLAKKKEKNKSYKVAQSPSQIDNQQMFDAIRFAGEQTGVRQAFLAGMFQVETGMGRNTGSCHYTKAKMGLPEQALFEEICQELGYDPDAMQVSCPQSGQRGGAIGKAQFLPSTWLIYRDRVAKVVGKDMADPWDAKDAAVAMAIKVADDAPGVTNHDRSAEANAAKMYLSGTTENKYNGHARKVLVAAEKFKDQF